MGRRKAAISGQLADTDLRLLRIFKTVVDTGGVTAAEIELNLANSTISNHIADLEKRLDMRLCERGRGGFKLTEHGAVVYQATAELLGALHNFRNKINTSHSRILGSMHLAITEHTIGKYQSSIVNALSLFTQLAPDVAIQITTMESDEVTSAVIDGRVDMGITVMPENNKDLLRHLIFEETMTLFCAAPHPLYKKPLQEISKEELAHYKYVESPRLMPGREAHPDMKHWNKQAKAHHQEARIALILSGGYLGFLPKHLVQQWGLEKQLKAIDHYAYNNEVSAICKKSKMNEIVIETFYSCLTKPQE